MQQGKVIQYKCPDCGADMAFDAASGKLMCASCGRQDEITNASYGGEMRPSEDHQHQQGEQGE